jgi:hypothetical protein
MQDGKRKTKYAKTQQEIKEWNLNVCKKLSQGMWLPDDKITVEEF